MSESPAQARRGRRILIGGGVRSGKSAFALNYACALDANRLFIATASAGDDEMQARIARHRTERGAAFRTLEVPLALVQALHAAAETSVVVVDCLTLWLTNVLAADESDVHVDAEITAFALAVQGFPGHLLLVSNEVGMGIVPMTPLGRAFRDWAGRLHTRLASVVDEVYFAAMGVVVQMHPPPMRSFLPGQNPVGSPPPSRGESP